MRRTDHGTGNQVARQVPPPFRVLAVPDVAYLSPSAPEALPPPPPRAPEPYKIAPSTTSSYGRAHRRSSFVILAESRPTTPESELASPTLPTGRVSPFRGRGFKGPPPHSMSRPQTPEIARDGRRRGKGVERRASVSQQNSPRRSLIPQPTYRQRSTSLTKTNDHSPSPKIGRRFDSKTRLNVSDSRGRLNAADSKSTRLNDSRTCLNKSEPRGRISNLAESRARFISNSTSNLSNSTSMRRQPTKGSTRLSPIQGTPTKPEKMTAQSTRGKDSSRTSPQKSNVATRRGDKSSSSKERVTSPSKIPLKANKNGSFAPSSNAGRFISMPEQNSEKIRKDNKKGGRNYQQTNQFVVSNGGSSEANSKEIEIDSNFLSKTDEVDLVNLVKQSSSHVSSGTSSERLVNTTTTTAVQPLHIDANALLINDGPTAASQQKERPDASSKSSIQASPASKNESSLVVSTQNVTSMSLKSVPLSVDNQPIKADQTSNSGGNRTDSPAAAESMGKHSKSGNIGQSSAKNATRTSGEVSTQQRSTSNQSSANQRTDKNARASRPSDGKAPEAPEVASSTIPSAEVKSGSAGGKMVASREVPANDRMPTVMESSDSKITRVTEEIEMKTAMTMNNDATMNNNATVNNNATMRSNNNVNFAIGAVNVSANGRATRARNENRGSDASLKSSAGASVNSIESVRSTDTGVSVNTVRGVSSPREKMGMHVVKRSQEIETLSGNVVHIEQNGEPAVLASSNEKQNNSEKLLVRWGRSLSRYCNRCRGMRCLACRRDPKGLLWTRNQGRPMVISDTPPPVATPVHDAPLTFDAPLTPPPPPPLPATNALSCWSKLKKRCRCSRLREVKCCAKKSRIAPAEPTVCCPPERRFGAICRRVFGCCSCKCKRADTQQRTKNVRAKHSLTSVAAPPLSEEQKAKIPDVLVEHNSVMRGAIPCLPVPLAWFCLVWNFLLPGSGTVLSGLFNLCTGQPRFSAVAGLKSRLGAFIVNLIVGVGQLFTVLFCLVGWGWSIWWGVTMVRLARKYKRFKDSEAAINDPEARGGDQGALPPGVPSQALRGIERAR